MRILLAEDDMRLGKLVKYMLEKEGNVVDWVTTGDMAYEYAIYDDYEVLILDWMMPIKSGIEVCKQLREKDYERAILMLTARDAIEYRVVGLDMGADDYIVKPFSPGEVMARIRAILRRISPDLKESQDKNILHYDNLTINIEEFTVMVENEPVSLTKKEIEILYTMAKNPNKLFTRDNLLNSLWGYDYFGDARTVDSHIKRLRAKLDSCHHPNWEIKTVWGMGYKFEVEK